MALVDWLARNLQIEPHPDWTFEMGILRLRERDSDMTVEIIGTPDTVVVLRMHSRGGIDHLSILRGRLSKICDFLLVAQVDGVAHAIFVELKKTLSEEARPREQLRRSLPLLEYLLSVKDVDCVRPGGVAGLEISYVLLGERRHARIDKRRTRAESEFEVESYESISIRKGVGTTFTFGNLTGD